MTRAARSRRRSSGRPRGRTALLAALLAVVVTGTQATAAGVGGATWTPDSALTVLTPAGFRVIRDSVYVFIRLTWDRAGVRALRRYEASGLRYTQELNDESGHLSATGSWVSDLPGASYDRDDDDGDGRWEEMEVTVTEASAIEPGRTYTVGFQLTRWSQPCGSDACPWRWSHRGGRVWALSQLSSFFLGEWQAGRSTREYAFERYGRMRRPGR